MSGATYRIEVKYDEYTPTAYKWDADVIRLSDGQRVFLAFGKTRDEAIEDARQRIRETEASMPHTEASMPHEVLTLYVDDEGRDAEQHSVKVS